MRINLYDKTGIYINTEDYVCLPRIGEFVQIYSSKYCGECEVLKVVHTSIGCPGIWLDTIKNKAL